MLSRVRIALGLACLLGAPLKALAEDYIVRPVYMVPRNRTADADYRRKFDASFKNLQQFYQMTTGKTFRMELDANGQVVTHLVAATYDDTYYHADMFGRVYDECARKLSFGWTRNVIVAIPETLVYDAQGKVTAGGSVLGGGTHNGATHG